MKSAAPSTTLPVALVEALLTTIIWGSSFVVAKIGLRSLGPITLAGLRYTLAFVLLLPLLLSRVRHSGWPPASILRRLALLGIAAYLVGNGAFFIALQVVPSTTVSFLMGLIPILILVGSLTWLKESPTPRQVLGLIISLLGTALFFVPGIDATVGHGLPILGLGILGFGFFGLLGRSLARDRKVDLLMLTTVPLGVGGAGLLIAGAFVEGPPHLTTEGAAVVAWLAVVNTAIAYLLYNHALQRLTALQMNLVLNLSPFVTAALASLLLDERLLPLQLAGMLIATIGVAQAQRTRRAEATAAETASPLPGR
ncbi:MAG: DMT family transporter [Anaerolineales bacterium]|nr:DMT family transporter [Anaerolineales bacterium]